MAWQGIWFEHEAAEGGARDPRMFEGLVEPITYPYAHGFIEGETGRLMASKDPSGLRIDGTRYDAYYSLNHDGGQTGLAQQGCRILQWLFQNFDQEGRNRLSARFSEIPIVIHAVDPARAAALANALTLLRFLGAAEDQAIAKMMLWPWNPLSGSPKMAALEYEKRVLEFLHGDIFYPEGIRLFDILGRRDLKCHRILDACCKVQIGFVLPLLEWIDECWPETAKEAEELEAKLRNSLGDEARYLMQRAMREKSAREREITARRA